MHQYQYYTAPLHVAIIRLLNVNSLLKLRSFTCIEILRMIEIYSIHIHIQVKIWQKNQNDLAKNMYQISNED